MTFFDTIQKSFVDVPVDAANDNAIHTSEFLDASESLTTLFGMSLCPPSKRQQPGCPPPDELLTPLLPRRCPGLRCLQARQV